ncbi:hypothetical protein LTR94_023248, partial [Friedmanniomyces endolithicus]
WGRGIMLERIIALSIRFRWVVMALVLVACAVGVWSFQKLPIDATPDITNVQIQINTEAPGYSPLEAEQRITFPVETAIAGVPGLSYTRSVSRYGLSQVTVVFEDGTDIYRARQLVNERLQSALGQLPPGLSPELGPIATGLGEIFMYTIEAEPNAGKPDGTPYTPEDLRTLQDWVIRPQMRNTPGVTEVNTIGGFERQYHVTPRPERLAAYGVTMAEVVQALERNNANVGAGYVERYGEQWLIRVPGQASTAQDLSNIVITTRGGVPIRIAEVAEVGLGEQLRTGAATENGKETVLATVLMLAGENSRVVAQAAAARLEEAAKALPDGVVASPVYDRTDLVERAIKTVEKNLLEGALLVIVVLFLLLGNIRAASITALMIPISFLFAVIGMNRFGISGNLMSLGALDFGLLVDGAVVVVENTLLMLSQRRAEAGRMLTRRERLEVAGAAARQMVKPAAFGQLIILLVFTPLLMLEGVEGKTFIPMGATVMLALVGAFIFSFTFVPAMTALLVRDPKKVEVDEHGHAHEHETFILRYARRWIEPAIRAAVDRPKVVLASALGALVIGGIAFSSLGREFIPTLDEGDIAMQALRVPSASLEQSLAMQMALERVIKAQPEVKTVFARTGTAEAAVDPMPPNISDAVIVLKDRKDWPDPNLPKEELIERFEELAAGQLGNSFEFSQPIELRFNELISGVRTDLAVMVYGDDFTQLQATADRVAAALRATPGSADVRVEQASGLPTLTVSVDRFAAANYGLSAADVSEAVSAAVGGAEAGQIFEGDRRFSVVVRLADDARNDPAALAALPVTTATGVTVPLSSVARIQVAEGQNQISRNDGSRRMVVQANVRGRDLGGFVTEAQAKVEADVDLPTGYSLTWGGQFENLKRAEQRLGLVIPIVFILIGVLLFMALGSFAEAGLVFACVPLALVGGALALVLRGMPFSVSAAVGFIAVSGVATLNGLVLMQAIRERLTIGAAPRLAAIEGATSRLRAVLTTALVAIVGFIPMAFAHGAGAEVQKPLATVVIGGLLTATALTLLVLPTFAAKAVKHRKAEGIEE